MIKPPMNQNNEGQQNNMMMSGPRMGMKPFNPRTSEYNFTQPGGTIQKVTRGGMPNFENMNQISKNVGMANFLDAIMPKMATDKFTNPVAQTLLKSRQMRG